MSVVGRYARLLGVQLRASFAQAAQYRVDFVLGAVLSAFWTAAAVTPLLVIYGRRPTLGGWTRDEALVVVGFFTLLKGAIQGVIEPSVTNTVEQFGPRNWITVSLPGVQTPYVGAKVSSFKSAYAAIVTAI